jgi:hypothetical protein
MRRVTEAAPVLFARVLSADCWMLSADFISAEKLPPGSA